ncbi:MAG: aminotransferase class III-fold pyridoxal phosphate-dependent enzyme [Spirochaetales bacterium]|nr:aminotransferase class III-fold pyridoxal phosphate-dependent enzyme [Spirochaetales bacterium]MCF7939806.1 aminotransferase class III-fold pyridoxal phosphate-dependent enzyme [Spirochaetales bacterium]
MDELKKHVSTVLTHASDILVDHAEGCRIHSSDGNTFLDFTSGIGVTNTGHCHPKVVKAVQEQAASLLFGQQNIVYHKPGLELMGKLAEVLPDELSHFFFSNSGAEAVEGAVKLAKMSTGRPNVIVFQGSFHGRTHLTMGMTTSKTIYRAKYQPLTPGIFVSPFPYTYYYRSRYGWNEEETVRFALDELERLLKSQTSPEETAAVIIEPILGEGGYVPAPHGFMQELRDFADKHGMLLISDEIQSGFGRTGKFFAFEHDGVLPDIVTIAKGLASGMPLSGIAYKPELAKNWDPGSHGGTYGGNPVSCAAASAGIDVIREERLAENAAARGEQLMEGLLKLQKEYPVIGDVRGRGLMVATEFSKAGKPESSGLGELKKQALADGLMLLSCGTFGNVIRWIPPLIVSADEIAEGLDIFAGALKKVYG